MTSAWKRRLLADHHADLAAWWEDPETRRVPDSAELETTDLQNWLSAARVLYPEAAVPERLSVRLVGEGQNGALGAHLGDVLLKPLNGVVTANAENKVEKSLELELVGLSQGSTVLHFRVHAWAPAEPSEPSGASPLAGLSVASVADRVLGRTINGLRAIENQADAPTDWAASLDAMGKLSDLLVEHELDIEMRWVAPTGRVRDASLTSRGHAYLAALRQTRTRRSDITVTGRVTELRENGHVKLKAGQARNSTTYDVKMEPETLAELHLYIGAMETFLVTLSEQVDRGNNVRHTEWTYKARGVEIPDATDVEFDDEEEVDWDDDSGADLLHDRDRDHEAELNAHRASPPEA